MIDRVRQYGPYALVLFIAFVFVQSLFFKYANAPETQHIFGTLEQWSASSFGIEGLFSPRGIFSQYVIGTAELVASTLLLAGTFLRRPLLQGFGALLAAAIMIGAISFHLFTPLGVVIVNEQLGVESDGGTLFMMANLVLASALTLVFLRRHELLGLLPGRNKAARPGQQAV